MEQRYRIIFDGETRSGVSAADVRSRLRTLCRYDDAALDLVFSGRPVVLKSRLEEATARRYRAALAAVGAVCRVEPMPVTAQAKPERPRPAGSNEFSDSVLPVASEPSLLPDAQTAPPARGTGSRHNPEAVFLLKTALVVAAAIMLRQLLFGGLLVAIVLSLPLLLLAGLRRNSDSIGAGSTAKSLRRAGTGGFPRATVGLILANLLIYYGIELHLDPGLLLNNYLFLPADPTPRNLPISALSSLFLHADSAHLWGNMVFLSLCGGLLEKRVGSRLLLAVYFAAGLTGAIFAVFTHQLLYGATLHSLGSSTAIAGAIGSLAALSRGRSLFWPLSTTRSSIRGKTVLRGLEFNPLILTGLFFIADLSGGVIMVRGSSDSVVGTWLHLGGFGAGYLLARLLRFAAPSLAAEATVSPAASDSAS